MAVKAGDCRLIEHPIKPPKDLITRLRLDELKQQPIQESSEPRSPRMFMA
jgi:hypothetical protein